MTAKTTEYFEQEMAHANGKLASSLEKAFSLGVREGRRAMASRLKRAVTLMGKLVKSLPKCSTCDRPATRAHRRGEDRFCDEHGVDVPEYPRAAPLRAVIEMVEQHPPFTPRSQHLDVGQRAYTLFAQSLGTSPEDWSTLEEEERAAWVRTGAGLALYAQRDLLVQLGEMMNKELKESLSQLDEMEDEVDE